MSIHSFHLTQFLYQKKINRPINAVDYMSIIITRKGRPPDVAPIVPGFKYEAHHTPSY